MGKTFEFLNYTFFSNSLYSYGYAAIIFFTVLGILYVARNIIFAKLEDLAQKTETDIDDLLVGLIKKIRSPEYQLIALYFAIKPLERTPSFDFYLKLILVLVFTYRFITLAEDIFFYWLKKLESDKDNPIAAIESVKIVFRIVLWVVAALFVLHNADVKIGALLTSLGIGGVALALASQTILGDIFNFFVILLDKPFKKGDFVILGGIVKGTIEDIGLKSTKIRSLDGELITVTNTKIFSDRLQNYSSMTERRVARTLGVTYQTSKEKLAIIPSIVKNIIEKTPKAKFDRANLSNLSAYSIDFEFVYYVTDGDFNLFMTINETIINAIIAEFAKEKIDFAYPTQTLFIQK